jgi:hypothetical protein
LNRDLSGSEKRDRKRERKGNARKKACLTDSQMLPLSAWVDISAPLRRVSVGWMQDIFGIRPLKHVADSFRILADKKNCCAETSQL